MRRGDISCIRSNASANEGNRSATFWRPPRSELPIQGRSSDAVPPEIENSRRNAQAFAILAVSGRISRTSSLTAACDGSHTPHGAVLPGTSFESPYSNPRSRSLRKMRPSIPCTGSMECSRKKREMFVIDVVFSIERNHRLLQSHSVEQSINASVARTIPASRASRSCPSSGRPRTCSTTVRPAEGRPIPT